MCESDIVCVFCEKENNFFHSNNVGSLVRFAFLFISSYGYSTFVDVWFGLVFIITVFILAAGHWSYTDAFVLFCWCCSRASHYNIYTLFSVCIHMHLYIYCWCLHMHVYKTKTHSLSFHLTIFDSMANQHPKYTEMLISITAHKNYFWCYLCYFTVYWVISVDSKFIRSKLLKILLQEKIEFSRMIHLYSYWYSSRNYAQTWLYTTFYWCLQHVMSTVYVWHL